MKIGVLSKKRKNQGEAVYQENQQENSSLFGFGA